MKKKTEPKEKRKYWYKTTIYSCVLCGHEKKYRERVYDKEQSGIEWNDDACGNHFC